MSNDSNSRELIVRPNTAKAKTDAGRQFSKYIWIAVTIVVAALVYFSLAPQTNRSSLRKTTTESSAGTVNVPTPEKDVVVDQAITAVDLRQGLQFLDDLKSKSQSSGDNERRKLGMEFESETKRLVLKTQDALDEIVADKKSLEADIAEQKKLYAELEAKSKSKIDWPFEEYEVKSYLGALFAPGYTQPTAKGQHARAQRELGPVSLQALIDAGALTRTDAGLLALGHCGSDPTNDRGRHSFPKYIGGSLDESEFVFLVRAQELLIKHQQLLVELGLLAP